MIAHTTPTFNSGDLAPRALLPALGLVPEKNYEVVFSGGHERDFASVLEVYNKTHAAAKYGARAGR